MMPKMTHAHSTGQIHHASMIRGLLPEGKLNELTIDTTMHLATVCNKRLATRQPRNPSPKTALANQQEHMDQIISGN